jgi:hypothetical protein
VWWQLGKERKQSEPASKHRQGRGEVAGLSLTKEERACRCRCRCSRCSRCSSAECRVQSAAAQRDCGQWALGRERSRVLCGRCASQTGEGGGGSRSRFRRTLFSLRVLCIKLYFVRAADREEPHQRWTRGGKMPGWSLD